MCVLLVPHLSPSSVDSSSDPSDSSGLGAEAGSAVGVPVASPISPCATSSGLAESACAEGVGCGGSTTGNLSSMRCRGNALYATASRRSISCAPQRANAVFTPTLTMLSSSDFELRRSLSGAEYTEEWCPPPRTLLSLR